MLFSAKWCSRCSQAKHYLAVKSIGYREVAIDTAGGKLACAQLFVNGWGITGFTPAAYDDLTQQASLSSLEHHCRVVMKVVQWMLRAASAPLALPASRSAKTVDRALDVMLKEKKIQRRNR